MEKLRNFYRKYLKNYLVLLFVIAVGIDHFPVHVVPPANFRSGSAGNDPDGSRYRQWCDPFQPDDAVYR